MPQESASNESSLPRPLAPASKLLWFQCHSSASFASGDVDAVEVVGAESTVAFGALPLAGVVAHLEALVAEDVEALGEHRLLVAHVAAGAA